MLAFFGFISGLLGDVQRSVEGYIPRLRSVYSDFVNLLAQSFRGVHRGTVCVCVFIGMIYERLRLYYEEKIFCALKV